jgi:hypothetical protein
MSDTAKTDYAVLDRPEVLTFLFHPRPEPATLIPTQSESRSGSGPASDHLIPVEDNVVIGARFHLARPSAANILFFHGNGEIVADYDELGPLYNRMGINFLAIDYRGYGRSTGKPTVTAMMRDCHRVLDYVWTWLQRHAYQGPIIAMGRSLGSAPALEIAAQHKDRIDGLIIESGFAYATPLLELLGINPTAIGFQEEEGFRNVDKIAMFAGPTLILHAEQDHIIPIADGEALYKASGSSQKRFFKIADANHNDIFMRALNSYLAAVKKLTEVVLS